MRRKYCSVECSAQARRDAYRKKETKEILDKCDASELFHTGLTPMGRMIVNSAPESWLQEYDQDTLDYSISPSSKGGNVPKPLLLSDDLGVLIPDFEARLIDIALDPNNASYVSYTPEQAIRLADLIKAAAQMMLLSEAKKQS